MNRGAPSSISPDTNSPLAPIGRAKPRLGFLGVGWIGRNRLERIAGSGVAEIAAIADTSPRMLVEASRIVPAAATADSLEALLDHPLDGLVIATPSALHADQSVAALERGIAVFCQKPLGRTASETQRAVAVAERVDRLLGVDLSYRSVEAFQRIREVVRSGMIGRIFAVDLVFHNAYGPDKAWFYDPTLAGGGCVMDLGVHLVDMALWVLGFPAVADVNGRLFARGVPIADDEMVEDYATARIDFEGGACARLACSWNLPVGQDAIISATFFGSRGGVAVRNVNGSFYDFVAERFDGTKRSVLAEPPDEWSGRAAVDWAKKLSSGGGFDPAAHELVTVAATIDRIYGR